MGEETQNEQAANQTDAVQGVGAPGQPVEGQPTDPADPGSSADAADPDAAPVVEPEASDLDNDGINDEHAASLNAEGEPTDAEKS